METRFINILVDSGEFLKRDSMNIDSRGRVKRFSTVLMILGSSQSQPLETYWRELVLEILYSLSLGSFIILIFIFDLQGPNSSGIVGLCTLPLVHESLLEIDK